MSKFLIIGNCIVDQVMYLPHYPQQDEELRASDKSMVLGGNACNSAQILAQLGQDVHLLSSLADDSDAQWIKDQLSLQGINSAYCVTKKGYKTAYSNIWINQQNGSRTIAHFRELPELSVDDLKQINVNDFDWIHFEGRNISALTEFITTRQAEFNVLKGRVSLEIEKPRQGIEALLPFFGVAIVSSTYLQSTGLSTDDCITLFRTFNPTIKIVCTLGDKGLYASDETATNYRIQAESIDGVQDTIGAGDCFIAALINALIKPMDFKQSLIAANKLAAYKIQKVGMTINGYQNSNL